MVNAGNQQGSKWWKFDFHTHTPASDDYGRGDASIKQNTTEEIWLRHAMQAKLDCVAITDHNSGEWIGRLKAKYSELVALSHEERPSWFRELVLFPGVEITVADSSGRVHLLAIFDPDKGASEITGILGACGIFGGYGDDKNTFTTAGFIETIHKINSADGIAIPAHIDGKQGLLENIATLTPTLAKSLKSIFAAEFCRLDAFKSADIELQNALRSIGKLAGSDAHKPEDIGRHASWIKMSRPCIQGLRLAVMDHEFCVNNQAENPNHIPDIYLTHLWINKMAHCGRIHGNRFILPLHSGFNAIIGGRGTGKSTVLESIRIAARRENELEETPKLKEELDKFMRLTGHKGVMLNDTEILLGIYRRGKEYRLRWRYDGQGAILEEKSEDDSWQACEQGNINERFPLSIYSQGQINELASNPKGLLDIIDRTPQVNRQEWQGRWDSTKSQFMQLRERYREIERQLAQESHIRAKLADVNNDLKQYEEKGHGQILRDYQKRSQQLTAILLEENFANLAQNILSLSEEASETDFPAHLFETDDPLFAEVEAIHNETATELHNIQQELQTIAEKVGDIIAARKHKLETSQWRKTVREAIQNYEALAKDYEERNSHLDLSVYGRWVQQRGQLEQQLARMESLRKELETIRMQLNQTYKAFLDLRQELLGKRNDFIVSVIGNSPYVRMELIPFGDASTCDADYRSLLGFGGDNFRASVLDESNHQGVLWQYANWEKSGIHSSELPGLIQKIKTDTEKTGKQESREFDGRFIGRVWRIYQEQPTSIDQLWCWWPEDLLRVKYSRDQKTNKFDELEKGSAGQKAAAILAFLLSHGTEPLIIDQPENDLDNALISDLIVTQIHANKTRRQLVIVTHNPNIVVNGDAELVHVFQFRGGQVQADKSGGLVDMDVREAVCTIMEGGREAFDKRYKRITMEVSPCLKP